MNAMQESPPAFIDIRNFYGLKKMPFPNDIPVDQMFRTPALLEITQRVRFATDTNMYFMAIGDVGAGKSTSLRYACAQLPKQYQVVSVIGGQWSFVELIRQTLIVLNNTTRSCQPSTMLRFFYESIGFIRSEGKIPVLVMDEAHLFKPDVFSQLHLLTQQSMDAPQVMSVILCGQDDLYEKMQMQNAKPIFSRVQSCYNLSPLSQDEARGYIDHQILVVAGCQSQMFSPQAVSAISSSSGGCMRNINAICTLAMQYCASRKIMTIEADHIRKVNDMRMIVK
jgi:type II secretory pathway predicted ATPase ExeA